jgi:hypothetical protein
MSTQTGSYDTSRMYRSGSHRLHDDALPMPLPAAEVARMMSAFEDRAAYVANTLRPAASAVAAYAEYLLASAELPRDQQSVLDLLCRQARTILWGLSALSVDDAPAPPASTACGDRAIA